jgi:hypothetical protein
VPVRIRRPRIDADPSRQHRLWGNTNDLRAHLSGLRDMIKCRGGFRTLGLHGLISKLAISLVPLTRLSRLSPEADPIN